MTKPKKCKCPCGELFTPIGIQKFINQSHLSRWYRETEEGKKEFDKKKDKQNKIAEKQKEVRFNQLKKEYNIKKVSDKRAKENKEYLILRADFLAKVENQVCFIDGCTNQATTIEHRAGRWGKNYLDISTWAGCCLAHNLELENNPALSKKYQLSKITGKPKL